ncbi:polyphosphate kinase 1 [Halopenitus persicus]|uniref:polyphosphate kinase 1 n=1 Tax=Halopenitus persicus TaxID=1048396 RepID=UPI000BBAF99F|nr:polyphosphate kinase 1 [Halopenitus persicus]
MHHSTQQSNGESATEIDLTDPDYYLNRELSELAFQERVLREGLDERNPPLERLRFLAFFTKNTDEFFMKRVGGLKQQIDANVRTTTPDGRTPAQQWEEVLEAARPLFREQSEYWRTTLKPTLAESGIAIRDHETLPADERETLRDYFEESILPTLTPLVFDPAHPFPFISNRSLSLAVLSASDADEPRFTRIKIPSNQPRLVEVPGETHHYVLIEDLIEANLDLLLPGLDVRDVSKFKVTRNAEVRRNEEVAEDLIDLVEEVLEQRRFATVVRLEVDADMPDESLAILTDQLDVDDREVFHRRGPIDFSDFFSLTDCNRSDLKLPDWKPRPHPRLGPTATESPTTESPTTESTATESPTTESTATESPTTESPTTESTATESPTTESPTTEPTATESRAATADVFREIRKGDVLVHHPYHSFEGTVQRFLDAAAHDPDVLAVKAAIYRTASDSKVIQSLIDAADNGKQVAVMVELKARFDERNNLEWVRQLEEEGIHVAYGTVGLKTHTKTALVVRREDDGVKLYSHVGTGNYHSGTAKGYSDLGLLTADRDIGLDLTKVFNFFTGPTLDDRFRKLLIAPVTMRERFTEMVRREAEHARSGRRARIVVKVNGLEDPSMVEELYRASRAGVDIDLLVRDICRLRPGIEGVSENITVHSIVGRFLEHARIFYFENGGTPEWYLGSADWMTRNLDHRVEAVTPVENERLRRQLRFILEASLRDNRRRWVMQSDGSYERTTPSEEESVRDIQHLLMDATDAALDHNAGMGLRIETDAIDEELLVTEDSEAVQPVSDAESETAEAETAEAETDTALEVPHGTDPDGSDDGPTNPDGSDDGPTNPDGSDDDRTLSGDISVFETYSERWYHPDSESYEWAVRTTDGNRRYFKTRSGARDRLRSEYGTIR